MDVAHPAEGEPLAPEPSQLMSARSRPLSISKWARAEVVGDSDWLVRGKHDLLSHWMN
jgi:hypothetical protein